MSESWEDIAAHYGASTTVGASGVVRITGVTLSREALVAAYDDFGRRCATVLPATGPPDGEGQ